MLHQNHLQMNNKENFIRAEQIMYNICMNQMEKLLKQETEKIMEDTKKMQYPLTPEECYPPQYYTPSIEDLRVGYEYEEPILDFSCMGEGCKPLGWTNKIVGEEYNPNKDLRTQKQPKIPLPRTGIRTPYLTKEQIEAEEWVDNGFLQGQGGMKIIWFNKGKYRLIWGNNIFNGKCNYSPQYEQKGYPMQCIQIETILDKGSENERSYTIYCGISPSINEFRTICKLLNI